MADKNNKESENGIWLVGVISVLVIIGLWYYTYCKLQGLTPQERGTFGDMFGSVNALYSGLAFAGIIFTILLQRKELKYQRDELRETRQEFITQNKTLKSQRFENTFYNLISLHNQIVNDIDYDRRVSETGKAGDSYNVTVRGRDVFRDRFNNLNKNFLDEPMTDFNKIFLKFYEERKTDFGHYFRNLYRIIKIIHETEFYSLENLKADNIDESKYKLCNYIERYRYTSIVRAQLSDYELLILFYNCLSDNGVKKFKPLIEEYALLKNLPQVDVFHKQLINKYKKSAYHNKNDGKKCV